ncbi:MAG: hypothetical protein M9964_05675 [Solirubrobacterales bacterium]|nr:hypothetical protein [Solirubrobacterales bacterium]
MVTFTVPASVPSLRQISGSLPSTKSSVPFRFVRCRTVFLLLTALTWVVPASVPSVFQIPLPATKKSDPPTTVRFVGLEPLEPGMMSLTRTVPASVPSVL